MNLEEWELVIKGSKSAYDLKINLDFFHSICWELFPGSLWYFKPRNMLTSKEGLISHVFGQILAYFGTFMQFLFISSHGQ